MDKRCVDCNNLLVLGAKHFLLSQPSNYFIKGTDNDMHTFPESTINLTPSIVTEVSAMFVDTIHFLTPSGAISNTCLKIKSTCSKFEKFSS